MSAWYWLLWTVLTVVNVAIFVGTGLFLRDCRRLLNKCEAHREEALDLLLEAVTQ